MFKLFIASLLLCLNTFALETLKIESGRYVTVENNIQDASKTTLIFLPGINRGLDQRDVLMQLAKKDHVNFVSMHFSLHPESLMAIPANETPYFQLHTYTAHELANEVLAVIKKYKITKPLVVGLSYSSIVTTDLAASGKLPLIIETAPMIRFDESDPAGASVTGFWKNYFSYFGFYGALWKDFYLKQVYEQYWSGQVDSILTNYPQYQKDGMRSKLVSAYAQLSMAADGFDFSTQDFKSGTKRLFILGQNEEANRFELQKKAIALYEENTGETKTTVVLKGAGHIVPSDAPEAYLKLLKQTAGM